jgi:methionine sulfoxide reductase heme-binding subunit
MTTASLTLALWYLGRGTGVVSMVLLSIVVALGIATRSGRPLPGLPRFAVAAIHRSASLLAVVLLGVHVGALLIDPFAQLRLVDLVLPFVGTYRPLWLGLGTLGFDLVLALVGTSLLRHRIGLKGWRIVHWLAYAAWPVAILHGLGTGTDAATPWLRATTAGCFALVAAAVAWRTSSRFAPGSIRAGARQVGAPAAPHGRPEALR